MRAVIDTNILISGFISKRSYPAKVLDYWILNKINPVVSRKIVEEYADVLARDKFSALGSTEERLNLLHRILSLDWVVFVYPQQKIDVIKDAPKDNIFLECAIEGNCEFVVSGDQHLLQLKEYRNIKIIKAEEFINLLK
ncbi:MULTISPECIES: putative toxin-antitoxin system toxin component, PIN family [Thermoanaerobacter]|uniref:PIN family toxin of toxin-antitoxin system n=1 Tax=Thermoanaerobacter pentosaceus TaxID=694059 RepID=A0ABT9M2C8_9THEO|nr:MULTISPECIES: putative toxin-antitoxin system toxin component, PIN family [Thermoanaerobacter]MDP9750273.1 putative PIN family toxin of toxin-antitoxin system [Thermoanaerobacter pentosaceus]